MRGNEARGLPGGSNERGLDGEGGVSRFMAIVDLMIRRQAAMTKTNEKTEETRMRTIVSGALNGRSYAR